MSSASANVVASGYHIGSKPAPLKRTRYVPSFSRPKANVPSESVAAVATGTSPLSDENSSAWTPGAPAGGARANAGHRARLDRHRFTLIVLRW